MFAGISYDVINDLQIYAFKQNNTNISLIPIVILIFEKLKVLYDNFLITENRRLWTLSVTI